MRAELQHGIGVALMSAWIGAAVLLAASVAPAAFAVLPTRTLAGDVVGRILPVVFVSGMVVTIVSALLSAPVDWARRVMAAIAVIVCAVAQFLIGPRIARVRDEIGAAVDIMAVDHPQRVLFGRLHMISVALLGAALLATLIFVALSLRATRARS